MRVWSDYLWQDGEAQVTLSCDGPCGGEGQARGLAPKNQIRWWRASDSFVMMDRARPFEATSNRINHLKNIWWNGIGIGVPQDNERKMKKKGIPNGVVLFLFTFEFRNAVLLRGINAEVFV